MAMKTKGKERKVGQLFILNFFLSLSNAKELQLDIGRVYPLYLARFLCTVYYSGAPGAEPYTPIGKKRKPMN